MTPANHGAIVVWLVGFYLPLVCILECLFWIGMFTNIKQREGVTNHDKPNRKKAAERFNSAEYAKRMLIGGVFGAEETRRYQQKQKGDARL